MIFTALNQTLSGSLQGAGKIFTPAKGLLLGCIAKFILNIVLIRRPEINIYGAPISSIVCQIISFAYSFSVLRRCVDLKLNKTKHVIKPLLCSILMGVAAYLTYTLTMALCSSNFVAVILAIAVAAVVYLGLVLILKVLSDDDIVQLPMGVRILQLLKKVRLYK